MKDCIDLRPICKERRWKWRFEGGFRADHITPSNLTAPWYVEIICKNGLIYPKGGDELLVCVEGHPNLPSMLKKAYPEIRVHQGNVVFRFPFAELDKIAAIMKPRRKRRPSPEAIERGRAALAKWRAERNGQGKGNGLESTNSEGDR